MAKKKPVTTLAVGEEGPERTSASLGEEDPKPTTLALGEEGGAVERARILDPFGRF